jgi:DNA-binding LacI/PurR family transcriptional regulator
LLALGHRRIVVITRRIRRYPTPGRVERAVLDELAAHGVTAGPYHLPDWEETPAGYSKLLESLFLHTPPTAMIIDEVAILIATMGFLARRRIHVPEQVPLVSTTYEESLAWCHPSIAHPDWDNAPIARRVLRWVVAVRKGRADRKTINYPAEFVPGGSIGPVGGEISDQRSVVGVNGDLRLRGRPRFAKRPSPWPPSTRIS